MKSREITSDEVRDLLINKVISLIKYWDVESRAVTSREKMEGLVHSIFATLDGCSELPSFSIIPHPHPSDKEYYISNGENYYGHTPIENLHDRYNELR